MRENQSDCSNQSNDTDQLNDFHFIPRRRVSELTVHFENASKTMQITGRGRNESTQSSRSQVNVATPSRLNRTDLEPDLPIAIWDQITNFKWKLTKSSCNGESELVETNESVDDEKTGTESADVDTDEEPQVFEKALKKFSSSEVCNKKQAQCECQHRHPPKRKNYVRWKPYAEPANDVGTRPIRLKSMNHRKTCSAKCTYFDDGNEVNHDEHQNESKKLQRYKSWACTSVDVAEGNSRCRSCSRKSCAGQPLLVFLSRPCHNRARKCSSHHCRLTEYDCWSQVHNEDDCNDQ